MRNILLSVFVFCSAISSQAAGPSILPPDAVVAGRSAGEWAAECWKWVWSFPSNSSPILDCTGSSANNRQPSPDVFFISPLNGITPPCERTFTIPAGKHVLLPMLVVTIDNIGSDEPPDIPKMYEDINAVVEHPKDLYAILDGQPVSNPIQYRVTSPPFSVFFPSSDNALSVSYQEPIVGLVDPIITDGYWLLLEPLEQGEHLFITGGWDAIPLFLPHRLTCHITVVSGTNHPPLADAGAAQRRVLAANGRSASVILDGSRSSDPDGDALTFRWVENGVTLATDAVTVQTLSIGSHAVELLVSDRESTTSTSVTLQVLTPAQAVEEMIQRLARASVSWGEQQPLLAQLHAIKRAYERGHMEQGAQLLKVFTAKLSKRSSALNTALSQDAAELIQLTP